MSALGRKHVHHEHATPTRKTADAGVFVVAPILLAGIGLWSAGLSGLFTAMARSL